MWTGTVWTAVAHIVTGVIGLGVLSLAWSISQLGWIGGPLAMLGFAAITLFSSFLLCNAYRSPDPEKGPLRHPSYVEAVEFNLGTNFISKLYAIFFIRFLLIFPASFSSIILFFSKMYLLVFSVAYIFFLFFSLSAKLICNPIKINAKVNRLLQHYRAQG